VPKTPPQIGSVLSKRKRHEKSKEDYSSVIETLKAKDVPQKRDVTMFANGRQDKVEEKIALRTFPIMYGIPMDEVLFSTFFIMFLRNAHAMPWDGLAMTLSTYLPEARNKVHNAFLDETQYSHLFMLDSDIVFPPFTVEKLLAHQLPVVGGYYLNKSQTRENTPVVYRWEKDNEKTGKVDWMHIHEPGTGLEKVDGIGMGCVMMRRDAAEALGKSPYDMNTGGEDLRVCRKLMQLGIPLHVDWSINCAHLGVKWS